MASNGPNSEQDRSNEKLRTVSSSEVAGEPVQRRTAQRFPDVQGAARFPIKLPVSLKSKSGDSSAEIENISANGVLFQVSSDMPVGSPVNFTISLPADVVGAEADVQLDCRGRVVRSFEDNGRRGVGVVIDEYRFERH